MTPLSFILAAACAALQLDPTALEEQFPQETVEIYLVDQAEQLLVSPGETGQVFVRREAGLPPLALPSGGGAPVPAAAGTQLPQEAFPEALGAKLAGHARFEGEVFLGAATGPDGSIAVGTSKGLYLAPPSSNLNLKAAYPADVRYSWAPRDVRAVAFDAKGRLWIGCNMGIGCLDGENWTLYTGKEGMPFGPYTCAAAGGDGSVWLGTSRGAIRFDGNTWLYRAGARWLADDEVRDIEVDAAGTAWILTKTGVSRIARTEKTLAEKAAEYERIVDERHRRLGQFVLRCYFTEPGKLDTAYQRGTDNDGLYTSMYGAAECYRYAATKDPQAKQNAQAAFAAVKLLFEVTGIKGFPARAVIPTDSTTEKDPNIGFGEEANLAMQKEDPLWKNIVPRWPVSADGKYWWKCDTSSDELAGHYFFFATYHDFVCESDEERKEVVGLVHDMTGHIVDHGFTLTDHDGKPTRWANWSPEYVNGKNGWADRSLQSVEILSFLNVGLRLTGDKKFARAAKELRDKHQYHMNAIRARSTWPPSSIVPWDNNLAFLSFYGLINYEQDPELKGLYLLALDNAWSFSARQNDPFFNIVYLALNAPPAEEVPEEAWQAEREKALAEAVETLVRAPQLLINWNQQNSHRWDVYRDPTPRRAKAYGWMLADGSAVPIEERSHIRINSDHFDLDVKGDGMCEYEGTFFLLPYYMGRYYGLIGE